MKYVLVLAFAFSIGAFGIGVSAQAATPVTHKAIAAKSEAVSGVIKTGDTQAKDTKSKKKKKKKA